MTPPPFPFVGVESFYRVSEACGGAGPCSFAGGGAPAPRTDPPDAFGLFQAVQGGRVKRYSSQRQRPPVPEPAPPMHISIMEGHYYDPRECFPPAPEAPCALTAEQLEQESPPPVRVRKIGGFVFPSLCK